MIEFILKKALRFIVFRLYSTVKQRERLKLEINNDTYLGAQIDSGGHLLGELKPITDYEIISILNALKGSEHVNNDKASSEKETYYKERWL